MSATEKLLVSQYGVLLTMEQCASLLGRSAKGLRVTLSGNNDLAHKLKSAKIKLGRRVLFKASELARVLDEA